MYTDVYSIHLKFVCIKKRRFHQPHSLVLRTLRLLGIAIIIRALKAGAKLAERIALNRVT